MTTCSTNAWPRRADRQSGFTLAELLVVVIIIGILAAVAVPVFNAQKSRGVDAALKADLRNANAAVQTMMADGTTWAQVQAASANASKWRVVGGPDARQAPPGSYQWNAMPGVTPIVLSPRTYLEVVHVSATSTNWPQVHAEGDYCLVATATNSSAWDWPGTNDTFDQLLYFDPRMGGVVTVSDIHAEVNGAGNTSCGGYARTHAEAGGSF